MRVWFFETVAGVGLTAALEEMVRELENVDPPPVYRSDHERMTAWVAGAFATGRALESAAADGDMVEMLVTGADLFASRNLFVTDVSPSFCRVLDVQDEFFCAPEEELGGSYGSDLQLIWRRHRAELDPRFAAFTPGMTADERFAVLRVVQPVIETVLEETLNGVSQLSPPDELESDHAALVRYLEETRDTARQITLAAEAQDDATIAQQFGRSAEIFCTAVQSFSPSMLQLTGFGSTDCP